MTEAERDAIWNAAIEAAAKVAGSGDLVSYTEPYTPDAIPGYKPVTRQRTRTPSEIAVAIRALATPSDMVMVPREPTEAMWGAKLVQRLIAWQRNERPTPRLLFEACKHSGVEVPQWLMLEKEMQSLDNVTSKGTVAVLIYRAMIGARE